jgi:hypothetical protein
MVPLDAYIRREDHVDIIGGRPFEFMRAEVSWLADLLRPDAIEVDRLGEPLEVSPPSPSIYRWGRLLRAEDLTATVWKTRFGEGSWFRGVMQRARDEYPSGMLGSLVKEPGN